MRRFIKVLAREWVGHLEVSEREYCSPYADSPEPKWLERSIEQLSWLIPSVLALLYSPTENSLAGSSFTLASSLILDGRSRTRDGFGTRSGLVTHHEGPS